jgi:hypothetical protein
MEDVLSYNVWRNKRKRASGISWSWADILILGIWLMVLLMMTEQEGAVWKY